VQLTVLYTLPINVKIFFVHSIIHNVIVYMQLTRCTLDNTQMTQFRLAVHWVSASVCV